MSTGNSNAQSSSGNSSGTQGIGIDPFAFGSSVAKKVIDRVKAMYAILGIIGVLLGVAILFWPGQSLQLAAILVAIYFIISAIVRVVLSLTTSELSVGWRILAIIISIVFLIFGIWMLRNVNESAIILPMVFALLVGIAWIIEGIFAMAESQYASSQGWAIFFGILSLIAGVIIIFLPAEGGLVLILFAAIFLIIFGILFIIRAFTFGNNVLKQMKN